MPKTPTVLLTRSESQSQRFAALVRQRCGQDVSICISPVVEIRHVETNPKIERGEIVIATSENAVRFLDQGVALSDHIVWCVGAQTEAAINGRGGTVAHVARNVADLLSWIKREAPSSPMLHLRGRETTTDMCHTLGTKGYTIRDQVVYEQITVSLTSEARYILANEQAIVPVFSRRSAERIFCDHPALSPTLRFLALSQQVADALPVPSMVLSAPTGEAMLEAIAGALAV